MRALGLCLLWLIVGGSLALPARTLSFPEQNFQCEVPDTWSLRTAASLLIEATSPSGHERFAVASLMINEHITLDSSFFLQRTTSEFNYHGLNVEHQGYVMMHGLRFSYWQLKPLGLIEIRPMLAWFILADGRVYKITAASNDDPASHPELISLVDSFRFINPPHIPLESGFFAEWGRWLRGDQYEGFPQNASTLLFVGAILSFAFLPIFGIGLAILAIKRHEKKIASFSQPPLP